MPPRARQPRAPAGDAVFTVADRLHASAIRLLRSLREVDVATGLSGPRASALSVVVFRGPLPIGALAAVEQVRPPTMTRLVAGMERRGLVERARDPGDGRVQVIRATAKGRAVLQAGRRRRVEKLAEGVRRLPVRERNILERAAWLIDGLASGGAEAGRGLRTED
jgi:DNA-binding MarR family transcriptional regulator